MEELELDDIEEQDESEHETCHDENLSKKENNISDFPDTLIKIEHDTGKITIKGNNEHSITIAEEDESKKSEETGNQLVSSNFNFPFSFKIVILINILIHLV